MSVVRKTTVLLLHFLTDSQTQPTASHSASNVLDYFNSCSYLLFWAHHCFGRGSAAQLLRVKGWIQLGVVWAWFLFYGLCLLFFSFLLQKWYGTEQLVVFSLEPISNYCSNLGTRTDAERKRFRFCFRFSSSFLKFASRSPLINTYSGGGLRLPDHVSAIRHTVVGEQASEPLSIWGK